MICESPGDDLVNFWRKAKAQMGGADFDVLYIRAILIDASLPRDDRIGARINRGYRRAQQNPVAQFYLGDNRLNVNAASMEPPGDNRILGTADHWSAEGDDPMDEIGSLAGRFSGQIASKAPTDESNFLPVSARK